jgi:hypothetical protein
MPKPPLLANKIRDQQTLGKLLSTAAQRYDQWRKEQSGGSHYEMERLLESFPLITPDEIDKILGQHTLQRIRRRLLPLEPPQVEPLMWPFLVIDVDFVRPSPSVRLVLMLCGLVENFIQRVMLRFESSTAPPHNFCHAQFTRYISGTDLVPPSLVACPQCKHRFSAGHALEWVSTTQPSFALDAFNAITLAICVLVTLYGAEFFRRTFVIEVAVQDTLGRMFCGGHRPTA